MANVLVTGAQGAVGRPVCRALLDGGHDVLAFDREPATEVPRHVVANITDEAALLAATDGMDVVIHLAAQAHDKPFVELIEPNVLGLYQVLNAARVNQVPRVVLASSIQALGRRADRSVPAKVTEQGPDNHYALTKLWAESMGQMYAHRFGLTVIAVRIAWLVRNPVEAEHMRKSGLYDIYLSAADAGRLFTRAVEAEVSGFSVVYAASRGGERAFDMGPAKTVLGYEACDRWPEGLGFDWCAEGAVP